MKFEYHRFAIHMRLICFMCLLYVANSFADNMFCVSLWLWLRLLAIISVAGFAIPFISICMLSFFLFVAFCFYLVVVVMRRNFFTVCCSIRWNRLYLSMRWYLAILIVSPESQFRFVCSFVRCFFIYPCCCWFFGSRIFRNAYYSLSL